MLATIWNSALYQPLVNALVFFYQLCFDNLGLAIIVLTILLRLLLTPLTLPSMKAAQKMKELAPQLADLKKRYGKDKQKLASAQMELYKKNGANPAAGCLPQIVQLVVLVALYNAFIRVLNTDNIDQLNQILYPFNQLGQATINAKFLYLNLIKPDLIRIPGLPVPLPGLLLLAAAGIQFLASKMSMPAAVKVEKQAAKTPEKTDDMAAMMQTQMLYMFPLMTILIGFSFPAGLALYWFVFSLFTVVQQYLINLRFNVKK